MKMDQKTNLQRICVFAYVTLLKGRVKVTSTGCTAASFSLLVSVTSSCVWRSWMERTSHVQRSTSRPSTSPTCWSAKLRWSYPATWPTGLDTNTQQRKITWSSFLKLSGFYVVCAVEIFSNSFYMPPPPPSPPVMQKKRKKSAMGCWLPWWCVFLGWFLLLSISGVSTFFTLLYGFEYGREKSTKWVMSLGLSLFQSIFILQPLKVV